MTASNSQLLDLLEAAGLTGRGGAGFSTAVKVRAAAAQGATLIVNACDGEYDAVKDEYVVTQHLDELVHGAALVARRRVRYAAHRGSAAEAVLLGAGLEVLSVPPRYVASEESALASLAHGGLARPLSTPVPIVFGSRRSDGRRVPPTVVLNAETVWRIRQIHDFGVDWYRSFGTPNEPGPRLASVAGAVRQPGVLNTQAGVWVGELVQAAGGVTGPVSGVGFGGLGGGWLSPQDAEQAQWSRAFLQAYGLSPGPGTVFVLGDQVCPLVHVSVILDDAAQESAGQCGPCMFGVPAVADDMARLAFGTLAVADMSRLTGRLGLLPGRGACRFPDGVAGYARTALTAFAPEVQRHLQGTCTFPVETSGSMRKEERRVGAA
jgi:NADH:ubiquinone oxidoreductase subunit F (NADH-binding)